MDKFILLLILYFASANIPNYLKITRNNTLNFQLDNPNSTFYAYLPYEEDYEINDISNINNHFLRLDKKIGFKHRIIENNEDFPDESIFNKNSKGIDSENNYEYQSLEPFENIKLKEYYKLEKDKDINKTSIFVFYLENDTAFDSDEEFSISRVQYNIYNNVIIDTELESNDLKLYVFETNYNISNNSVLFINSPISTLYEYNSLNYEKINSNMNLFQIKNEVNITAILLFVYNPNDEIQNVSIEYRIKNENQFYRSLDLRKLNNNENYTSYGEYRNFFYLSIEPGLYKIQDIGKGNKYIYLFKDDINEIKNLTDLKKIEHYKYTREGYRYISENHFIIMISSSKPIILLVEKKEIKDEIKDINMNNFEYFKISKGNTINFRLTRDMENIIFKLVSSNSGNVMINNINYEFNQNKYIHKVNIQEDNLIIEAKDNSFIFAIKLEIPNMYIYSISKEGENSRISKGGEQFLIYEIKNSLTNAIYISFDRDNYAYYTYELTEELNEEYVKKTITKGDNILYHDFFPHLDLQLYTQKTLYLTLYIKNYNDYNSLYFYINYTEQIQLTENNLTKITNENNIYFYKENKKNVFFFIPYYILYTYCKFTKNESYTSFSSPEIFSQKGDFGDYLHFMINENRRLIGYYIYYQLNDDEEEYSYVYGTDSELYHVELLNDTHIRFYINETFSNSPQIDYTLVVYNPKTYYQDSKYEFFIKYYLNEYSETEISEVYKFTNKDLKNNINETEYIHYTDLPFPKTFNFNKKNQKFEYRLMGITGPKYTYVKIYYYNTLYICYETCSSCSNTGSQDKQNCITCKEDKVFLEHTYYRYANNCLDECPKGYYEKDNICKECYSNCETCSGEGSSDNPNCLSCILTSSNKYLVNAPELGKKCVSECPEGTVLKKMECIKEEFTTSNIMITVGVVGGFIIIIIVVIICNLLNKILSETEEGTIMNKIEIKTPLDFKETEMESKNYSDFEKKEMENTPKDFEEKPEYD